MLDTLFNLIAVFYVFRGLQLAAKIWRDWRDIRQEPLTHTKKELAEQAAFFIAVPIGVFFHELGHALAVKLFGGEVLQFAWRAFWGFVRHTGPYQFNADLAWQSWFISLAGTLGSLLFGVAIWWLLRRSSSSTIHYFGVRAFRYQIFFSLLYYPIFTLLGFLGDWITIYNFAATPGLSFLTAVAHAGLLGWYWINDRRGWFEAPAFANPEQATRWQQIQGQLNSIPDDPELQLDAISLLLAGGATNRANSTLKTFLKAHPESARGHLQLAALLSAKTKQIPPEAARAAQKSLDLGLSNPAHRTYAHQLLAQFYEARLDYEPGINHASQAIDLLKKAPTPPASAQFTMYKLRSNLYRRQKQFDLALHDWQQMVQSAQSLNNQQMLADCQEALQVLEHHAGRPLTTQPVTDPPDPVA